MPDRKPPAAVGDDNFRVLVETIDDMILIGDRGGKLVYANPAAFRVLGYTPQELTGMSIVDLHAARARDEAAAILAAMLEGAACHCPLPMQHKSGALVPMETRVWLGRWSGAECLIGVCKLLGAEQEALQKFDRLFRMNPALMAVNKLPDRTFHDVNDAFLRALGYEMHEVIGRTVTEMNMFVDPAAQERAADLLVREGSIREIELQVRTKDGRVLEGLFSADLIHSQGVTYFLTVMVDITERQQTVRALRTALAEIRELEGILPICSGCKKIRDDGGYWQQVDTYIARHTGAQFSHGMCPDCMQRLYPEFEKGDE